MSDDIRWEDPPDDGRRIATFHMRRFVDELQRHPGKWALYINREGKEWHGAGTRTELKSRYGLEVRSGTMDRPPDVAPNMVRVWARWPEEAS